jgi:hypothetical protein
MNNEPKQSKKWYELNLQGWEIAIGAEFDNPSLGYEYQLIRRKKEEPMPAIKVGDVILSKYYAEGVVFKLSDIGGYQVTLRSGSQYYVASENVFSISRDGTKIWERK